MPELTGIHIGMLALMLVIGVVAGWFIRAERCAKEKLAMNATWQKEFDGQRSEHDRLANQNKRLMEQISQYQASHRDYSIRARELADSLRDATAKRDQLQRQLKDIRRNLEVAVAQRDKLRGNLQASQKAGSAEAIKEKDEKIFRLSRELTSWQSRVPPLVERFQAKDREARELRERLEVAEARIEELEELTSFDQTRIEALDAASLPAGGFASNEPEALTTDNEPTPEVPGDMPPNLRTVVDADPGIRPAENEEFVDGRAEAGPGEASPESPDAVRAESDERGERDADAPAGEQEQGNDDTDLPDDEFAAGKSPSVDAGDGEADVEKAAADEALANDDEDGDVDAVENERGEAEPEGEDVPAAEFHSGSVTQCGDDAPDDLQMIKGIGPSIQKTLNDLGIHRFQQIAEMSEYEIDRVAQQLRGFRSRIYRENWIGQARDLHHDKTGRRS